MRPSETVHYCWPWSVKGAVCLKLFCIKKEIQLVDENNKNKIKKGCKQPLWDWAPLATTFSRRTTYRWPPNSAFHARWQQPASRHSPTPMNAENILVFCHVVVCRWRSGGFLMPTQLILIYWSRPTSVAIDRLIDRTVCVFGSCHYTLPRGRYGHFCGLLSVGGAIEQIHKFSAIDQISCRFWSVCQIWRGFINITGVTLGNLLAAEE